MFTLKMFNHDDLEKYDLKMTSRCRQKSSYKKSSYFEVDGVCQNTIKFSMWKCSFLVCRLGWFSRENSLLITYQRIAMVAVPQFLDEAAISEINALLSLKIVKRIPTFVNNFIPPKAPWFKKHVSSSIKVSVFTPKAKFVGDIGIKGSTQKKDTHLDCREGGWRVHISCHAKTFNN